MLVEAGEEVSVASAGTNALSGAPMDAGVIPLVERFGAPWQEHVARAVSINSIAAARLVLTAAREHRAAVVRIMPRAVQYTFTLNDFSHLAAAAEPMPKAEDFVAQALSAVRGARALVAPLSAAEAQIVDPFGMRGEVYEQMSREVEEALATIKRVFLDR